MSDPIDLDGCTRMLSTRERITALLALATSAGDLDLRMAAHGAARQAFDRIEAEHASLRLMLDASGQELARLAKLAKAA